MQLKFKKLSQDAVTPTQATEGSAGFDLTAISIRTETRAMDYATKYIEYDTGIAVAIPEGFVGLIFPRSSISNYDLSLANAVGVIDSDYRGPIKFRFRETTTTFAQRYNPGDKVGQLVIVPIQQVSLVEVPELDDTTRGEGGYGSTGT